MLKGPHSTRNWRKVSARRLPADLFLITRRRRGSASFYLCSNMVKNSKSTTIYIFILCLLVIVVAAGVMTGIRTEAAAFEKTLSEVTELTRELSDAKTLAESKKL